MKKVSVINFKGGVGKTTLSYHLAAFLANNHRVLLIDIDHQSSLSIVVLGGALWQTCVKAQKTINRVFESFCNRKIAMPGDEIIVKNPIFERHNRREYYRDFYESPISLVLSSNLMTRKSISHQPTMAIPCFRSGRRGL